MKEYVIINKATYQYLYNYKSMTFHVVILYNGRVIFLELRKVPGILKVPLSQCLTEDWPNYVVSLFSFNSIVYLKQHPISSHVSIVNRPINDEYLKSISRLQVSGLLKELRDSECQWKFTWRKMMIDDSETTFKKERKKKKKTLF